MSQRHQIDSFSLYPAVCYTYPMRSFILAVLLVSFCGPCMAWDNPCYKGPLTPTAFPRENRTTLTLEARRVVSVEGNLMAYDLGGEKVVIKVDGVACKAFLKDVEKGRCTAKGFVAIEVEKKNFSGAATYKATSPGPVPLHP
jgi:hypothetical protein